MNKFIILCIVFLLQAKTTRNSQSRGSDSHKDRDAKESWN